MGIGTGGEARAGAVLEIDGAAGSGSGTIVRQSVAYAALTGRTIHVVGARARRRNPGLRHQHLRAVEAVRDLTAGTLEGAVLGAREFVFRPGGGAPRTSFCWDVGSAGSATALGTALLPVLAFRRNPGMVELRGGLFQDFAPSVFHLDQVVLPLLSRMGLRARLRMLRPGYVPKGGGILQLTVDPATHTLAPLRLEQAGPVERVWGIALSSHLAERRVSARMAASARDVLGAAGYDAAIEERDDTTALQAGAALAVFADRAGGVRLGVDRAGLPGRPAEAIGRRVGRQLLADLATGATVDRFTADQIIPFAALADGTTRFRIPRLTEHVTTGAWLARVFLDVDIAIEGTLVTVHGCGFDRPDHDDS
jgi:RNA 3'-terminal phosphate cyclase (ATP)